MKLTIYFIYYNLYKAVNMVFTGLSIHFIQSYLNTLFGIANILYMKLLRSLICCYQYVLYKAFNTLIVDNQPIP